MIRLKKKSSLAIRQILNRNLSILCLLLLSCTVGLAQKKDLSPTERVAAMDSYTATMEGHFYVLVPMEESRLPEGEKEVKNLIDLKGLTELSVRPFRIQDIQLEPLSYLIIRRFANGAQAKAFLQLLKANTRCCQQTALPIAQKNYRKMLRRRDFEGYKLFLQNQAKD